MYIWISFFVVAILLLAASFACFFDHRRRRPPAPHQHLSFLIPCYNDGSTIRDTIESIFASWDPAYIEVLVGNDASTDDSAQTLLHLQSEFPLRIETNLINLGKTETLNNLSHHASHAIIVFIDADTRINPKALSDMIARLASTPKLGAVSCPYRPANKGWLPRLQAIDYSMISLLQGAYNLFSGLALWGGCIAIRKTAFENAGRFSYTAITEDVDLAYTLNRIGWRVEQSLVPVLSYVPDTCRSWFKQKIRWTAGGFQCLIKHPGVWMRNPLQVLLILLYSLLSLNGAVAVIRQMITMDHMFDLVTPLANSIPLSQLFKIMKPLYGPILMGNLQLTFCFTLLSAIYVIPLISRWRDSAMILLIFPFSLVYFPLYSVLSVAGLFHLALNTRRIERRLRAW